MDWASFFYGAGAYFAFQIFCRFAYWMGTKHARRK